MGVVDMLCHDYLFATQQKYRYYNLDGALV